MCEKNPIYKEVLLLFEEYDTDMLSVSDFEVTYFGNRIDYLVLDAENGNIEIWCGNPIEDKHAEELVFDEEHELDKIDLLIDITSYF